MLRVTVVVLLGMVLVYKLCIIVKTTFCITKLAYVETDIEFGSFIRIGVFVCLLQILCYDQKHMFFVLGMPYV